MLRVLFNGILILLLLFGIFYVWDSSSGLSRGVDELRWKLVDLEKKVEILEKKVEEGRLKTLANEVSDLKFRVDDLEGRIAAIRKDLQQREWQR